ncbi:MAG: S49 family peptidase [Kiritimatiellae bacterium]|nr:S49 family peptidase [Kiritimatiellia bacterium]
MKRILALVGRSALAGVILAVTFCAGVALLLGDAIWWIQRSDAGSDGGGFVETFVAGVDDAKSAKVVRVEISGEIGPPAPSPMGDLLGGALGAGDAGGVDAFNAARARIHLATDEKDVKGLYLVIDSPGGDLTDSDLLWHDVQLFRAAQPDRFVFVHVLAQCCSGGYYVAAAADFIMVVPTGEVGSIGVISDYGYNVSDLARRFGVTNMVVSTGVNKDTLNPLKPVDPRQLAIEQGLIDSQFARFVQVVAEGRKMDLEKVRALADGRAYAAPDAKEKGLVDAIGYAEDAMEKLEEMAGGEVCVVAYEAPVRETGFLKRLFGGKTHVQRTSLYRRRGLPVPRLRLVR